MYKSTMRITIISLVLPLFAACGGGGGGGGDDSDSLDTNTDYDVEAALFGTPGETRNLNGSGTDAAGDEWTVDWSLTTLSSPDPADPCQSDETQRDYSLTLTEDSGVVVTASGLNCFTIGSLIQRTFRLNVDASPDTYQLLTTGGTLPTTAQLGDGSSVGGWDRFEDSNGDGVYDGSSGGDTFIGSISTNWKLEKQNGKAALVLSTVFRDSSGTQAGSETDTFFIKPDGTLTGFKIHVVFSNGGELTVRGDVN